LEALFFGLAIFLYHIDRSKYQYVLIYPERRRAQMGKLGKNLLGKLVGSGKSCCCCGPSIVSVRKVRIGGKDMELAGLGEEFETYFAAGKAPEDVDGEELMQNLLKINAIPEAEMEKFKVAVLKEYETYWKEKKA